MSVSKGHDVSAMTERRLARTVRRACNRDARAFGRLYDEYAARVYAFVRSRTDSAQDAEDITATVFLKAWEAIGTYDDRGLPFAAWLFRIARNAVIDEYRRKAHRPVPIDEPIETGEVAQPTDLAVIARADAERVRAVVRMLTEEQASVIAMRFWWDMSIKDTAEALNKNPEVAAAQKRYEASRQRPSQVSSLPDPMKALQHRAVRALARLLQEGEDDGA